MENKKKKRYGIVAALLLLVLAAGIGTYAWLSATQTKVNEFTVGSIDKPEGHPYLRLTRTLAPGMVVTIEPGIYFIDMLLDELKAKGLGDAVDWARVDAFKPYGGIRIEDDVVCTDGTPLNLTREAFAAA